MKEEEINEFDIKVKKGDWKKKLVVPTDNGIYFATIVVARDYKTKDMWCNDSGRRVNVFVSSVTLYYPSDKEWVCYDDLRYGDSISCRCEDVEQQFRNHCIREGNHYEEHTFDGDMKTLGFQKE